jgi:hypothetical protein
MKSCLLGLNLLADIFRFLVLTLRSISSLAAENLFLRKQLSFYRERGIKPGRISRPTRMTLLWLSRLFDWRNALTVVTSRTFSGWQRNGFRFYWRLKCQSWPATDSVGAPTSNRQVGSRESLVGRGANCKRDALETRPARVAAHGSGSICPRYQPLLPRYNRGRPRTS